MKKDIEKIMSKADRVFGMDIDNIFYLTDGNAVYPASVAEAFEAGIIWEPTSGKILDPVFKAIKDHQDYGGDELAEVDFYGLVAPASGKVKKLAVFSNTTRTAAGAYDNKYVKAAGKGCGYFLTDPIGKVHTAESKEMLIAMDGERVAAIILPVHVESGMGGLYEEALANMEAEKEKQEARKAAAREKRRAKKEKTEEAPEEVTPEAVEEAPADPMEAAEEETPKEYKYLLAHRGVSIGTQPAGFTRFEDMDKTATGYYGAVWYDHALTPEELANYELTPAEEAPEPEKTEAPEKAEEEKPEKARKGEKTDPKNVMTAEEAAAAMAGDDWKLTASMLMGWTMRNNNLIMQAALEADLLTPAAVVDFIFNGKMPHFHTFNEWKNHGYIVQRGEKAAFQAKIWKYKTTEHVITEKEAADMAAYGEGLGEAGDIIESGDYLMKTAYFFTADQVEKITRGSVDLPDDCKREMQDGREIISGNTRPIKEQLKAAGYMWDRKRAAWWRPAEDPQKEATPAA